MHVSPAAAGSLGSGWLGAQEPERARLAEQARASDAARQLQRCFPRWSRRSSTCAGGRSRGWRATSPSTPTTRTAGAVATSHAQVVLRRHGLTRPPASRLTTHAQQALIDGQAASRPRRRPRLDAVTARARRSTRARAARTRGCRSTSTTRACSRSGSDQRRALCARLGLAPGQADDLSRWVLEHPDAVRRRRPALLADRLARPGCGSPTSSSPPVERVERPVGVFVVPARPRAGGSWSRCSRSSDPSDRRARRASGPRPVRRDAARRRGRRAARADQPRTRCTPGAKERLDSAGQLAQELTRALGRTLSPGVPRDKRDRWGRLLVTRRSHTSRDGDERSELALRVVTFPAREFSAAPARRGAARSSAARQPSAVMELGEAVQTAVERGLPLLLSTEAAGHSRTPCASGA